MIKVFVQKTMAKADIDTPLTSGSVGLEVEFVFSEDWSGLTKTAVFETSSFYKETAPLSTASTIVPADVMAWEEETLYIGVYGTAQNGEIVIPTVYANCGRIHKGANDSEGGRPLIPAQSDILQNQIDSLGGRVAWLEATGGGGGSAGILLDTTLTQSGKAADAKAVGDALENVGGKAYVQDTEPAQMEVGEFWYNPDETGGSIPTTLPNPHKLTFSGAVSAEYDGSEAVEVVIPQGGGGSSGGAKFKLLASSEPTTEAVTRIDVSIEEDGITEIFVSGKAKQAEDASSDNGQVSFYINGKIASANSPIKMAYESIIHYHGTLAGDNLCFYSLRASQWGNGALTCALQEWRNAYGKQIKTVGLQQSNWQNFAPGAYFEVWGR
jgi:hypothetical protein